MRRCKRPEFGFSGAFLQRNEGTLGQRIFLALGIHRIGEGQIRIGKRAENIVRRISHLPCCSQELFLRSGQGMGLPAAQIRQIPAVAFQCRILPVKLVHVFFGNGHDLRCIKAGSCSQRHKYTHKFALHSLIGSVAGIFVGLPHAVIAQPVGFDIQILTALQIGIELLRICQPASKRC